MKRPMYDSNVNLSNFIRKEPFRETLYPHTPIPLFNSTSIKKQVISFKGVLRGAILYVFRSNFDLYRIIYTHTKKERFSY